MTPKQYFKKYPKACHAAQRFCRRFKTMRAAWLSPRADVEHMLWGLSRRPTNLVRIRAFAVWCADQAEIYARRTGTSGHWVKVARRYADEARRNSDVTDVQCDAALAASYAADTDPRDVARIREAQRAKLRELFPRVFIGMAKGAK